MTQDETGGGAGTAVEPPAARRRPGLQWLCWCLEIGTAVLVSAVFARLCLPLVRRLHLSSNPEIDSLLGVLVLLPTAVPLAMIPAVAAFMKLGGRLERRRGLNLRAGVDIAIFVLAAVLLVPLLLPPPGSAAGTLLHSREMPE